MSEAEPITLEPPLEVAWTYELPWNLGYEIPPGVTLAADGILYIGREDFGDAIIIALVRKQVPYSGVKNGVMNRVLTWGIRKGSCLPFTPQTLMHWTQKPEKYCGVKKTRISGGVIPLHLEIPYLSTRPETDMCLLLTLKTGL